MVFAFLTFFELIFIEVYLVITENNLVLSIFNDYIHFNHSWMGSKLRVIASNYFIALQTLIVCCFDY